MKKTLLLMLLAVLAIQLGFSQTDKAWKPFSGGNINVVKTAERESFPTDFKLIQLDLPQLRQVLFTASDRFAVDKKSVIISIPNSDGKLERYEVYEASNFDTELQLQFPEIRSYVGQGLENKSSILRLSIDPKGIQTMVFKADKGTEFMEPYSEDGKIYAVYNSARKKGKLPFTCSTPEQEFVSELKVNSQVTQSSVPSLLTFRLALSCNGEYANYFGATGTGQSGLVLAQFNATMTRVNGVFEKDFAIHMNIVAQTTNVIFYNPATDPYTTMANWNTQLQQTLNTRLTGLSTPLATNNAAYDVGHMFGSTGGGGNAGCIGCVCVNGTAAGTGATKGRGITSPADGVPMGDTFDIDYVAHELGHQFGANHTFSNANEGYGVNKEVGGGATIMGYAGITNYNTNSNSIDIFHSASIEQVEANMSFKSCQTVTPITHSVPSVDAGSDYTIPISTPFVLTGSATDAGGTGLMTYTWEQNDDGGANVDFDSPASETKVIGPNFVCLTDSSSPTRYFPTFSTILSGYKTTAGEDTTAEALSSVGRTLNFRFTARDNVAGQGLTNFGDVAITVDATKGPFNVTSQNVPGIFYPINSSQTVTWSVNNTNTLAGGANVDILISTDNGSTWSTLVSNTPNDGSQVVTMPSIASLDCRIMIKSSGNIFLNVNTTKFAVGYNIVTTCNTYSNNTALAVPDGTGNNVPGAVVTKSINVPTPSAIISDVNVTLGFTHTYIEDLVLALNHPDGTQVRLWNRNCDNAPGSLEYIFDDSALNAVPTEGCTATSGSWKPTVPLSSFSGKVNNGTWTLLAVDYYTGDTGTINNWSIQVCSEVATLSSESFGLEDFTLYPNPNNGNFNVQFTSSSSNEIKINVHDIRGRSIYNKTFTNTGLFNESINLNDAQTGIYLVTIEDGAKKEVKKIVVE